VGLKLLLISVVKVKQSRYRPGVAQRVPRKLRFPDYMTTAQDGGKVVSLTRRPPLKVKRSRYRPGVAQRVPRKLRFPDYMTTAQDGGKVVSLTPRPLYPRERPGTHCIGGWVGPRAGLYGCGKSRPHRDSIPATSST
jgi:hypothetical protein